MNRKILSLGIAMLLGGAPSVVAQTTLKSLATERGRYVGSILNSEWFNGSVTAGYENIHKAQFNVVVAENEMKFDALEPSQNTFSWTKADKLLAYAEANGMRVRGHALAWHSQVPGWVTNGNFNRTQLLAILKNHITTVVGHYKGRIHEWDVVNEAINDNPVGWRGIVGGTSVWAKTIGSDFIDSAFVWAHAADPDADLYYNDYSLEWGISGSTKAAFLLTAVDNWVKNGIPITGVGTQTHIETGHTSTPANIRALAKALAAKGLTLQITELDIGFSTSGTRTAAELAIQGHLYAQFMDVFLEEPNMNTFMMWGFTDKYSWLPSSQNRYDGLIYDANYNKKPAYDSLIASLNRHSVASVTTWPIGSSMSSSSSTITSSSSSVITTQSAYDGVISLPGTLQVENYDVGGAGVAFYDSDTENEGGFYRTDGVDIGGDTLTKEYVVGWTATGEWLEYTVNFTTSGVMTYEASVASNVSTGEFHIEIDGVDVTGTVFVESTGGWDVYASLIDTTTSITAGSHILRLYIDAASFNIDWIKFSSGKTGLAMPAFSLMDKALQCSIYGVNGKLIKRFTAENIRDLHTSWNVNSANLPMGLYFVKYQSQDQKMGFAKFQKK